MSKSEEDLTKFDLGDLIEIANKIAEQLVAEKAQKGTEQMVREKVAQESVERLFKISSELQKRFSGNAEEASPGVAQRPVRVAVARPSIGKEIQGSRTRNLRSPGGRR